MLFQLMARAMARSGKRFMKSLELAINKYRHQVFFAPEVVIEGPLRCVYCRNDTVDARLDVADILN
jgi:hypothetical protein